MAYIIIGAGPAGLAAALHLVKFASNIEKVDVYESRPDIPNLQIESYPIGVNQRGIHCLNQVSEQLAEGLKHTGEIVDSWQIFAGPTRKVAHLNSGVVYGTTRSKVNLLLFKHASENEKGRITIHFSHKLETIDFDSRTLEFLTPGGAVKIDATNSRIIAADGFNSKVRRELEAKRPDNFKANVIPWTNEYRVLFAKPGALVPSLDTKVHYIFSACYAATVAGSDANDKEPLRQWTTVMTAKTGDSVQDRDTILATLAPGEEATSQMIENLRKLLKARCPADLETLFDDDEIRAFYKRRTFKGAVVDCSTCRFEEWILLIGDSYHSLLPPTGEGINSALEDATILGSLVSSNSANLFEAFENARSPDIKALMQYALHLNSFSRFSGERGAKTFFMIMENIVNKQNSISALLFGPESVNRKPYREIVKQWSSVKSWALPVGRVLIYPWTAPFAAINWIRGKETKPVEPPARNLA